MRRSAKYDRAFTAVKSVVDAHDPIGLLGGGSPSGEYGLEMAALTVMVMGPLPISEDAVDAVWVRWFGSEYGSAGSEQLALLTRDLRAIQESVADE